MVKPIESIVKQALNLPEADRVAVIRRLIDSLDQESGDSTDPTRNNDESGGDAFFSDPAVEQAWAREIQRRVERMDRGEAVFTPGHEVISRIREQLRRSRDAKD